MKKATALLAVISFAASLTALEAQDNGPEFDVTADLYSNYIWRGSRLGTGPHVQPGIKFVTGNLTLGVWGSFNTEGYSEADPYISFALPLGFTLGVTDYYYPDLRLSDVSKSTGSHALEINGGYTINGFSLGANYIVNEAGGAGSMGGDVYFQAGYAFEVVSFFAGAGNGWHTEDQKFNICNIGASIVKVIQITEKFSLPLTGQLIINPDKDQLFLLAGFSF